MQQLQNRQRQAINRYNQAVRDHNRKVNTPIDHAVGATVTSGMTLRRS
jgi:hypothetical protein